MGLLSVVTTAWLLCAGASDGESGRPMDEMQLTSAGRVGTFDWRDAEERVDGFIDPISPVSGKPFEVSLQVRALEGERFTGPVILTVRRAGEQHGQSATVVPEGDRWRHTFTVDAEGAYQLDVGFRSTRMKVVHAPFLVKSVYPLPLSTIGLVVVVLAGLAVVGRSVIRSARNRKPTSN